MDAIGYVIATFPDSGTLHAAEGWARFKDGPL